MFNTTGARIIVCCCYKDISAEDTAKVDMQAMKIAKEKFGYVEDVEMVPLEVQPILANTQLDHIETAVL